MRQLSLQLLLSSLSFSDFQFGSWRLATGDWRLATAKPAATTHNYNNNSRPGIERKKELEIRENDSKMRNRWNIQSSSGQREKIVRAQTSNLLLGTHRRQSTEKVNKKESKTWTHRTKLTEARRKYKHKHKQRRAFFLCPTNAHSVCQYAERIHSFIRSFIHSFISYEWMSFKFRERGELEVESKILCGFQLPSYRGR